MKLLKRKEIIELWQKQPEEYLDSYCCPNCRDMLFKGEDYYECRNSMCSMKMRHPDPDRIVSIEPGEMK